MYFKRLRNDEWFDEIKLVRVSGKPILRLVVIPRYKTSGLSGDEWRISAQIQYMSSDPAWTRYCQSVLNLEAATMVLYPELFNDKDHHDILIGSIDFYRKGRPEYQSTYNGKPLQLIHVAGHLPWATVLAGENVIAGYNWEDWCFQPGCSNLAISTYRLRKEYSSSGNEIATSPNTEFIYHRRFCRRHLQRGDAGLEDGDHNYIVVDGPGPSEAEGWEYDVSEAVFGGVVDLRPDAEE